MFFFICPVSLTVFRHTPIFKIELFNYTVKNAFLRANTIVPSPKKDKSWVRSKIDSAKEKYEAGKQKIKSKFSFGSKSDDTKPKETFAQKTTSRKPDLHLKTTKKYGWNSNIQAVDAVKNTMFTTKKPLFDRVKEKVKGSGKYVGKAVGWAKKDLGIGVEGPKKPSKILTYGKKAAEYVFKKVCVQKKCLNELKKFQKSRKTATAAYSTGTSNSNGYSRDFGNSGSYSGGGNSEVSSDLHQKVEYLKHRLEIMQNTIQGTWNTSEAGTKYKLFEEKKTWNDAQVTQKRESQSRHGFYSYIVKSWEVISHIWTANQRITSRNFCCILKISQWFGLDLGPKLELNQHSHLKIDSQISHIWMVVELLIAMGHGAFHHVPWNSRIFVKLFVSMFWSRYHEIL